MISISIGFPSGTAKLTLWGGTEDEEQFKIKGLNKKPYVMAHGIKYPLTSQETELLHDMMDSFKGVTI